MRKGVVPVSSVICDALTGIKEIARKASYQGISPKSQSWVPFSGSREILLLGRLKVKWREIVGQDLYSHTMPMRLQRGRLFLLCSDSQWLQTLNFLKETIKEKVRKLFPDIDIKDITARLGQIKFEKVFETEAPWPDWKQEIAPPVDCGAATPETVTLIQDCARKMKARMRGILLKGLILCPECKANTISPEKNRCSVCDFRRKTESLTRAKTILNDSPWLNAADIGSMVAGVTKLELDFIRESLLDETKSRIDLLIGGVGDQYDPDVFEEIHREMIRAIILKTSQYPHQVSLDDPLQEQFLAPGWKEFLTTWENAETC